jgi:dolichol kinase
MNDLPNVEQSYGAELVRKTIHLCSLSIPVVYHFTTKSFALSILIPLLLIVGLSDLARLYHPTTRSLYHKMFGWLLRRHERDDEEKRFNGATYVLLSACLFLWLFPKLVFITAFSILIVSDTLAALVGRKFGAHPFMKKSAEGTLAFFISALIVVAVAPKAEQLAAEFAIGGAAALVGTLVEASGIRIDDNLTIPASVGGVLWMSYAFVVPHVNVFALDVVK